MRLRDFLPELPAFVTTQQRMDRLANLMEISKAGEIYRAPTLGAETSFVNAWLHQQMAQRTQMVNDLMAIALTVEEIRSPIHHITSEVFRKGIEWTPKFAVKCKACDVEYQDKLESCTQCKTNDFKTPDESQKELANKFLFDCNIWDQSLEEVLRIFHRDVNAIDDGYLYLAKEYYSEETSKKVVSKLIEIRRLDPAVVEIDIDPNGLPKNSHYLCYIHREEKVETLPGQCSICQLNLVPAMYLYRHRGKIFYFFDSEVIHLRKFHTDESYGWSPILTIFEKAMTIKGMDQFLYRYFFERKMPSSMIMVFTDDPNSLRVERENIAAKLKQDPHYIPLIAVSSRQNRGRVDMLRLFNTLQEMDYLPVRQEIRERISSMWGVTPIWQSSADSLGGIASQSQQLVVMSRVVESDQRMFNEKVFPLILQAFGVTDWQWELKQPEEVAESTRLAQSSQKIQAASTLFNMGFDVTIKSSDVGIGNIEFIVSGKAKKPDFGTPFGGASIPTERPPES